MIDQKQAENLGYQIKQVGNLYFVVDYDQAFSVSAPQTTAEAAWERALEYLNKVYSALQKAIANEPE